jgi:hypothetical protein
VRCYWEHVEEDIGNMENMFGSHWELEWNTLGTQKTKKIQHPQTLNPKRKGKKKTGSIGCMLLALLH